LLKFLANSNGTALGVVVEGEEAGLDTAAVGCDFAVVEADDPDETGTVDDTAAGCGFPAVDDDNGDGIGATGATTVDSGFSRVKLMEPNGLVIAATP
jgi:hypothetical protein